MMGAAALLTVWGWHKGAPAVPALALIGYVLVRAAVMWVPPVVAEIAVCTIWLLIAFLMMYKEAWIPGFFYTLSGAVYPLFLIFGVRLGYLSPPSILGDVFAICALLGIGGGLAALDNSSADPDRSVHWFSAYSLGLAPR